MKKIISFLIATAIILLNFALIGCAKETKLGYFQEQRIKRDYIEQFSVQNKSVSEVVLDYYGGSYYGYEIVMLDAECHDPEERTEIIGDTSITYYDSNQLYAWKNGQFFTLDELYLTKVFSIDLVADIANEYKISIHNFSDVCDKHDFYYAPIDNYVNPMEFTKKLKNELCVRVDKKLSHLDSSELLKYLGYDYFSEISNSCQIKNGDTKLTVTICGNGIFDIVDAINHLATKPGINGIGVSYVLEFEDMLFSPNDTFYGGE